MAGIRISTVLGTCGDVCGLTVSRGDIFSSDELGRSANGHTAGLFADGGASTTNAARLGLGSAGSGAGGGFGVLSARCALPPPVGRLNCDALGLAGAADGYRSRQKAPDHPSDKLQ